ncbi:ribosome maturation factor RimM [Bacillus sp. Marseille-P3661]|uniref:ribosome maturation factor RimM n=1 Tax=Bacillus sp. Marseille-P3661 TaxID=1936234 RepID=UPI000C866D42|nr:ribosome maturation factor RimM [Bacillus sp. Marseille-P3661]
MSKYYNVGKIVNTHGVRGEVRVIASTDFPEERFKEGSALFVELETRELLPLTVTSHRLHKNFHLLTFEGYDNVNDVERFKGNMLKISENELTELDEDEYYYHEIIGCDVVSEDDGALLGVIKEILSPGANDVWVVKTPDRKELLLPYIEDVVKDVDIKNKKITVHLMEGLL